MSKERESASGAAEGARRATGGAPEERRDGRGRWSAKRKYAAVLRDCCVEKTSKHSRANWV
jgi:hypothetical protein